jgi:general secretion pathway protein B
MSYILDALRKADAERERDPARGIHAQAVPAAPAPRGRPSAAVLAGTLTGLLVVALGAYGWRARDATAPPPRPLGPSLAMGPVQAPPPPPSPVITVAQEVQPPAPPTIPKAPPTIPKAPPALVASVAPVLAAKAAPALAADAAPDRIVARAELPPEVQRELPKLAISGGVYSRDAAQRMLIVGGQVVKEGAELAPGVVLDQIRARSAVLRFRNWRYSVGF